MTVSRTTPTPSARKRVLLWVLLGLFLAAVPATAAYPPAGVIPEGRTDTYPSVDGRMQDAELNRSLVIDSQGDIYAAFQIDDPITGQEIHIVRSTDDGTTWHLWGRRYTNDARDVQSPEMVLVPGSPERIALAYNYRTDDPNASGYLTHVNVAVTPVGVPSPVWTVRTVFQSYSDDLGKHSFYNPDVDAVMGPNGPTLYVAASKWIQFADSHAPVFSRSLDAGLSWSTEVELGSVDDQISETNLRIAGDDTGDIVVAWRYHILGGGTDTGIARRTASGFGADWDSPTHIVDSAYNGFFTTYIDVSAHRDGSGFAFFYGVTDDPQNGYLRSVFATTPEAEGPWTANDHLVSPLLDVPYSNPRLAPRPAGGWLLTGPSLEIDGDEVWTLHVTEETLGGSFGDPIVVADTWASGPGFTPAVVAAHPDHEDGYAMFWQDDPLDLSPVARFDATWWSAPGAPGPVDGMPKYLAVEPATHPAVVDVTARSAGDEIVFGDVDGTVHVVDGDGNALPGWPQSVGPIQRGQAIAVGDLDGDGNVEIVVPNGAGEIHVFENDGTPRAGWPIDLGTRPAHVGLGAVSKITASDVVAVCGTQVFLLRPDGTSIETGQWPVDLTSLVNHPASIGDLDGDDELEVVVTSGADLLVYDRQGNLIVSEATGFDPFTSPASLGDLDRDGDLEILAATMGDVVHAWHHDGSTVNGLWPKAMNPAGRIVGLTIANLDGSADPEVLVTSDIGVLTSLTSGGATNGGFPTGVVADIKAPAIVDDVDGVVAEALFATHGGSAGTVQARRDDGSQPFAWPAVTQEGSYLSPATGDVDGDGNLDLIVLTEQRLERFDLNNAVSIDDFMRWTHFGHDPQRTFCAEGAQVVTGVESGEGFGAVRISFAPAWPNPTRGTTQMSFSLPRSARTRIELYDVRGRRVRVLDDSVRGAGAHTVLWNGRDASGRDVATGTYFGRLVVELPDGVETLSQKLTVMK